LIIKWFREKIHNFTFLTPGFIHFIHIINKIGCLENPEKQAISFFLQLCYNLHEKQVWYITCVEFGNIS